jgi:hypothetical protein
MEHSAQITLGNFFEKAQWPFHAKIQQFLYFIQRHLTNTDFNTIINLLWKKTTDWGDPDPM